MVQKLWRSIIVVPASDESRQATTFSPILTRLMREGGVS